MILLQAAFGFSLIIFVFPAAMGLAVLATHLIVVAGKISHVTLTGAARFVYCAALVAFSYVLLWIITVLLFIGLGIILVAFGESSSRATMSSGYAVLAVTVLSLLAEMRVMYIYLSRSGSLGQNNVVNLCKTVAWTLSWYFVLLFVLYLGFKDVSF